MNKDEIKRLESIVGKLPKTFDGVPITPGMEVFTSDYTGIFPAIAVEVGKAMVYYTDARYPDFPFAVDARDTEYIKMFSTRAAALAALEAK